jgi:tRNA nucleotidyltransferase/poly(A) polymerase/DNA topoisomerase IB
MVSMVKRVAIKGRNKRAITIAKFLASVAKKTRADKHIYIVGGAVRNFLLGVPIKDVDVVLDSQALKGRDSAWFANELVKAIPVRTSVVTNQYGVAILTIKEHWELEGHDMKGEVIEIANARKESYGGEGGKGYKPHMVEPATIEEDVRRREFTVNTLMWQLSEIAKGADRAEIVDITGCGLRDLQKGELRCPSDPDKTFSDDPTRLLRTIKFCAKYGFTIPPEVARAVKRNAPKMKKAPWEAIGKLLVENVLREKGARESLKMMKKLGLLDVIAEMVREQQPFATYLSGHLKDQGVGVLLDLAGLGVRIRSPISFLNLAQQERLREVTLGMESKEANQFLKLLQRPPVDQQMVFEAFGLEGPERQIPFQVAREMMLDDPDLAKKPDLTDAIMKELGKRRGPAKRVAARFAKTASWWELNEKKLPEVPDAGHWTGDGPLDMAGDFIDKIDMDYRDALGRSIDGVEADHLLQSIKNITERKLNPWIDLICKNFNVTMQQVMALPEEAKDELRSAWLSVKNSGFEIGVPYKTEELPLEPKPEAVEEFFDIASSALWWHSNRAKQLLGEPSDTWTPPEEWGKKTAGGNGSVTGDSTGAGFFIRIPEELGKQFPSLSNDDSPAHVTFLIVGDVKGREQEFLDIAETVIPGGLGTSSTTAEFHQVDYFRNAEKDLAIPHMNIRFERPIAELRWRLAEAYMEAGFDLVDVSPHVYRPHTTLGYLEGVNSVFEGEVPKGAWEVSEIEVWGMPKLHKISFEAASPIDHGWMSDSVDHLHRLEKRIASRFMVAKTFKHWIGWPHGETKRAWEAFSGGSGFTIEKIYNVHQRKIGAVALIFSGDSYTDLDLDVDSGSSVLRKIKKPSGLGNGIEPKRYWAIYNLQEPRIPKERAHKEAAKKEFWQMTLKEFIQDSKLVGEDEKRVMSFENWLKEKRINPKEIANEYEMADFIGGSTFRRPNMTMHEKGKLKGLAKKVEKRQKLESEYQKTVEKTKVPYKLDVSRGRDMAVYRVQHKREIRKALGKGKKVPQKVLKEYPELEKKAMIIDRVVSRSLKCAGYWAIHPETLQMDPGNHAGYVIGDGPADILEPALHDIVEHYLSHPEIARPPRREELDALWRFCTRVIRNDQDYQDIYVERGVERLKEEGELPSDYSHDPYWEGPNKEAGWIGIDPKRLHLYPRDGSDVTGYLISDEAAKSLNTAIDKIREQYRANQGREPYPEELGALWKHCTGPERAIPFDKMAAQAARVASRWIDAASLILYHGTTREFKKFDLSKAGKRDSGNLGRGIYLSRDPTFAMRYAEDNAKRWGGDPVVLKVRAQVGKIAPFYKMMPQMKEELGTAFPPRPGGDPARSEELRQWFMAKGFDAAEAGSEFVVFDPRKLKIISREIVPTEQERLKAILKHYQETGEALNEQQILQHMASRVAAKYKDKKKIKNQDGKDQIVYEYTDGQVQHRHREKAKKLEKLEKEYPKLRKQVEKDLKADDEKTQQSALAVALINETYERIGNSESAEDGHYGVTGWKKNHISFKGSKAILKYTGKSGVKHTKEVTDLKLVSALKAATKNKGDDDEVIPDVSASDINDYLKPYEITAKDMRGFHANREVREALERIRKKGPELPHARKEKDKILKDEFKKALEEVADIVGHTTSILRSDYLVPGLEDSYVHDGSVEKPKKTAIINLNHATDGNEDEPEFRGDAGLNSSLTLYEEAIMQDMSLQHSPILRGTDGYTLRGHHVEGDAVVELMAAGYLEDHEGEIYLSPLYEAKQKLYRSASVLDEEGVSQILLNLYDDWFRWCPVCGQWYETQTRGRPSQFECPKGHTWVWCHEHAVHVVIDPNVRIPRESCLCEYGQPVADPHYRDAAGAVARQEPGELLEALKEKLRSAVRLQRMIERRDPDGIEKWATKTPAEKEDEEIERLVRPEPKKKPPRQDLHRKRVKVETDPDVDHGDRGDDKDMSLNYKRVAKRWLCAEDSVSPARIAYWHQIAGDTPEWAKGKKFDHTTDGGEVTQVGWGSLTPDERAKYKSDKGDEQGKSEKRYKSKAGRFINTLRAPKKTTEKLRSAISEMEIAFAQGDGDKTKALLEGVQAEIDALAGKISSDDAHLLRQMSKGLKKDADAMEKFKEHFEKKKPEGGKPGKGKQTQGGVAAAVEALKKIKGVKKKKEELDFALLTLDEAYGSGKVDDAEEALKEAQAWFAKMTADVAINSPANVAPVEVIRKALKECEEKVADMKDQGKKKTKKNAPEDDDDYDDDDDGDDAKAKKKEKKKIREEWEKTLDGIAERYGVNLNSSELAKESYGKFSEESSKDRARASENIREQLEESFQQDAPDKKEQERLQEMYDGVCLAQVVNGETPKLPDGQELSPQVVQLAKSLKDTPGQDPSLLLGSMQDFCGPDGRKSITAAMGQMSDRELFEFAGGDESPYADIFNALFEVNEATGKPVVGEAQRAYARGMLERLMTDSMTFCHTAIKSAYEGGSKSKGEPVTVEIQERIKKTLDAAIQETGPEAEAFIEAVKSGDETLMQQTGEELELAQMEAVADALAKFPEENNRALQLLIEMIRDRDPERGDKYKTVPPLAGEDPV